MSVGIKTFLGAAALVIFNVHFKIIRIIHYKGSIVILDIYRWGMPQKRLGITDLKGPCTIIVYITENKAFLFIYL